MDASDQPIFTQGQRFGQFEILSQIGTGGMGQVYKARHTTLEECFAIKILHPGITQDPASITRLKIEARTAFRLKHENILSIDEFNQVQDKFYMRMPLMRGFELKTDTPVSLRELLDSQKGRLGEGDAAIILDDILNGLSYAHVRGVVHWDIKPANILFDEDRVYLSDFGLVRIVGEDFFRSRVDETVAVSRLNIPSASYSSGSSSLIGTYNYMSPEQKIGNEADTRSDVYAVGLLALDMLTGSTAFGMKAPSHSVKGLSPEWDAFLSKALEPEPEKRFQNASEMREAMPQIRTQPILLQKRSLPDKRKRSGQRGNRALLLLLLLASAGMLARPQLENLYHGLTHPTQDPTNPVALQDSPTTEAPKPVQDPLSMGAIENEGSSNASLPTTVTKPTPSTTAPANLPAQDGSTTSAQVTANELAQATQPDNTTSMVDSTPSPTGIAVAEPDGASSTTAPLANGTQQGNLSASTTEAPTDNLLPAEEPILPPEPPKPAEILEILLPADVPLVLKRMEPGHFSFGSPINEKGRASTREIDQHDEVIHQAFYIGIYEVTQRQYEVIMGRNPSRFRSADNPVEQITYRDLTERNGFIDSLNAQLAAMGKANLKARLPSEQEWEYACRAGSSGAFSDELPGNPSKTQIASFANFDQPYGMAQKVGQLEPNSWGLYDMHGNVEEITSEGVLRGGSWASAARECRSASRRNLGTSFRGSEKIGFRIVIVDTSEETPASPNS